MRTKKPISTVWFGTGRFLKMELDGMIKRGSLQFYAYVPHKKEEDEKKDHFHVYMVPDTEIDTAQLSALLTEYDSTREDGKPIKCVDIRSSKYDDWKQYGDHDPDYLISKGIEPKKYQYSDKDYITSNEEWFDELNHQINRSQTRVMRAIRKAVDEGESYDSLVARGLIPLPQVNVARSVYEAMMNVFVSQYRPKENYDTEDENDAEVPF